MKKKKRLGVLVLITIVMNTVLPLITEANELLNGGTNFEYTADGDRGGAYPTNGKNVFTGESRNDNISNFNYSDSGYQGYQNTKYIVPNATAFDGGYHSYIYEKGMEVYTKKTVSPTDDPTRFKIDLDVISGKHQKPKENLDIVFVFDKSSSMNQLVSNNKTRWNYLQESFQYFTNDFFNDENLDIQIGFSAFGTETFNPYRPFYEIAKNGQSYFFNKQSFNNLMANPLYTELPGGKSDISGSGTPTFLGLDAGFEILNTSRDDSKQYLIFLTDGEPTFNPRKGYETGYKQYHEAIFTTNSNTTKIKQTLDKQNYKPRGKNILELYRWENETKELKNYINSKYNENPNVKKYSVGISNDVSGENTLDILGRLGPDGTYPVTGDVASGLKQALIDIKGEIINSVATVSNGTIIDPMSEYVDLVPNSVTKQQLTLNSSGLEVLESGDPNEASYVNNVVIDDMNNQITTSNVTLKGGPDIGEGLRVSYEITLKNEFKDGYFYPANKLTYMSDANHPTGFEFAVPSVKYKAAKDIEVEKIWKGENKNHPKIKLSLLADGEVADSVELNKGETTHIFKDLKVYNEAGKEIVYDIKEDAVKGYESVVTEEEGKFTVTNYPKGDFEATKTVDKDILKPGDEFNYTISVTNTILDSTLKDLSISDLVPDTLEVISNAFLNGLDMGAIVNNQLQIVIPELKGKETAEITFKVKVKETTPAGEIVNKAIVTNPEDPENPKEPEVPVKVIRETDLHILKTSMDGTTILPNAKFSIQNLADENIIESVTDNEGKINFSKLLPGDYLLKEEQAPDGFKIMKDPIKLTIDIKGEVTVTESNESFVSVNTVENQFEIKVKNEERGILPLTGGNGHIEYLIPAAILFSLSLFLSIYYLLRRRKGWN